MIPAILAEILGTFFFISVILATGEALSIGAALAVAIWAFSKVSAGSFNPAVTLALLLRGSLDTPTAIAYIIAEVIGGILAYIWWKSTIGASKK
jgi:aquaporin Z